MNKTFKINNINKKENYVVDCGNLQLKEIINSVKLGYNSLVLGSYKSGKTLHLNELENSIKDEYFILRFSFPNNLNIEITNYICSCLKEDYGYSLINQNIESDSLRFLLKSNLKEKKIVLLFDDFHNVINQKDIQQFLISLKRLNSVHSIVIVGNYDLLKISTLLDRYITLPPGISFESIIFLTNFTKSSTFQIFKEWSKDNNKIICDQFLDELYDSCNGNPYLIGIVGLLLSRKIKIDSSSEFTNFQSFKKLIIDFIKQQQQYHFLKTYINKTSLYEVINDIFLKKSRFDNIDYLDLLLLSNYGLFYIKDFKFYISAPILFDYLFDKSSLVL